MSTSDTNAWRFHFDFISPYAFLAWTQIRGLAARHGRTVEPVPVLFAALLDANGQKGPAEIPAKRRYLFKDVARKAHRFGIGEVRPPPAHPFNPLLPLRLASLPPRGGDLRERIIDALFVAAWTKGRAIDAEESVVAILEEAGVVARGEGQGQGQAEAQALVAEAKAPEAKARLRAQTEAAIAEGVFGVPTVIADGEMFWGTDSLEDLDRFAAGIGPNFTGISFADVPVGIVRKAVRT